MNSRHAAVEFWRRVQAGDPESRARFKEIVEAARQGDPRAIRAMMLLRTVMRGPQISGPGNVSPQRLAQLRQMLINARYSAPVFL